MFVCACVRACVILGQLVLLSESTHIINRITVASDRRRFCFSEGDIGGAAVSVTPLSVSFNLVIRMACCVIVTSPHRQRVLAVKAG